MSLPLRGGEITPITVTNVITPSGGGSITGYKKNGIVVINITSVTYTSSMSTDTHVFTIDEAPYSGINQAFILATSTVSDPPIIGVVQANTGKVYIRNYTAGHYINGEIVFIAK